MNSNLMTELYNLQNDYANGKGEHGPVLHEFSRVLERYKKIFLQWKPFHDPNVEERKTLILETPKTMLITVAIITAIFIPYNIFFVGFIDWLLFFVIAGFVMRAKSEENVWAILMPSVVLIALIVGKFQESIVFPRIISYALLLLFAGIAAYRFKKETERSAEIHAINKKIIRAQLELEVDLDEERELMWEMLPELRAEYQSLRKALLRKYPEEAEDLSEVYQDLPKAFWWEVEPELMEEWTQELDDGRSKSYDITWETRAIERGIEDAFQAAGEEFTPLYSTDVSAEEMQEVYSGNRIAIKEQNLNGKIIDLVTLILASDVEKETITYSDYQYNTVQRIAAAMEWSSIGDKITRGHEDGKITDSEYQSLQSYYRMKSVDAYNLINEEVEKSYDRSVQVKDSTFLWTGQVLLLPDDEVEDGYILVAYHCQFGFMFENLQALKEYNITRVLGDMAERNPVFMAKVHQIFPNCR